MKRILLSGSLFVSLLFPRTMDATQAFEQDLVNKSKVFTHLASLMIESLKKTQDDLDTFTSSYETLDKALVKERDKIVIAKTLGWPCDQSWMLPVLIDFLMSVEVYKKNLSLISLKLEPFQKPCTIDTARDYFYNLTKLLAEIANIRCKILQLHKQGCEHSLTMPSTGEYLSILPVNQIVEKDLTSPNICSFEDSEGALLKLAFVKEDEKREGGQTPKVTVRTIVHNDEFDLSFIGENIGEKDLLPVDQQELFPSVPPLYFHKNSSLKNILFSLNVLIQRLKPFIYAGFLSEEERYYLYMDSILPQLAPHLTAQEVRQLSDPDTSVNSLPDPEHIDLFIDLLAGFPTLDKSAPPTTLTFVSTQIETRCFVSVHHQLLRKCVITPVCLKQISHFQVSLYQEYFFKPTTGVERLVCLDSLAKTIPALKSYLLRKKKKSPFYANPDKLNNSLTIFLTESILEKEVLTATLQKQIKAGHLNHPDVQKTYLTLWSSYSAPDLTFGDLIMMNAYLCCFYKSERPLLSLLFNPTYSSSEIPKGTSHEDFFWTLPAPQIVLDLTRDYLEKKGWLPEQLAHASCHTKVADLLTHQTHVMGLFVDASYSKEKKKGKK